MYLYKNIEDVQPIKSIDFSEYMNSFAFFKFTHRDNRLYFSEQMKIGAAFYADFAAAVTAQLLAKHASNEIIKKGLYCCRAILHSKGYKEANLDDLHDNANISVTRIILVLGCQSDEILESRVDAAIYLIRNLCTDIELAFIGCAPDRNKVKILDESARMRIIYENRAKNGLLTQQDLIRIKSIRVFSEDASQNTKQNIQRFFNGNFLSPNKKYILHLVSSTFHLLRLANDCEGYLESNPAQRENIKRIILCGADDVNQPSITAKSGGYIKYTFFDILRHLMSEPDFFQEKHS